MTSVRRVARLALPVGVACALAGSAGPGHAQAPPGTDVWIAPLGVDARGIPTVGEPTNASDRPGYDNQPYFTPDGSGFWYTVIDDHTGQADIWLLDVASRTIRQVIASNPESEYSATPIPDGSGISVIRVEADSTQRLWRFDMNGRNGRPVFMDLAPVGYHKWADEQTVVMFVLGSPATLRVGDVRTQEVEIVAENIGRSIQRIPGTSEVSFVQRHSDGSSTISRLDPTSGTISDIVDAVEAGDDHTWTPAGWLLQAHGSKLYAWHADHPASDDEGIDGWHEIADFAALGLSLSRLAVSPDGRNIALVAEFEFD